jgi:hypothetical protein
MQTDPDHSWHRSIWFERESSRLPSARNTQQWLILGRLTQERFEERSAAVDRDQVFVARSSRIAYEACSQVILPGACL